MSTSFAPIAASLALLLAIWSTSPAQASEDTYVSAQETSTALAGIDESLLLEPADGAGVGRLAVSASVDVQIPADPNSGVGVEVGGINMAIALPGSAESERGIQLPDGTVTYPAKHFSNSVIASETGVQLLTTIPGSAAPTRFVYEIDLPKGATIVKMGEHVSILDRKGTVVLTAPPAWAIAADGASVPTHFAVEGDALVQYVEHRGRNVAYPVVADPSFAWWGVLPTVKLTRSETYKMRYASTPTKLALCVSLGGVAGVALAVPCAASLAVLSVKAGTIYASGRCLRVIIGPGVLGGVDYKDSYCK